MEHAISKEKAVRQLLAKLEAGDPILMVGLGDDVPTIHNFYPGKYFESIRHLGFGSFEGRTEHGTFYFNGGGAMSSITVSDLLKDSRPGLLGWTYLSTDNKEVLADLGYDVEKVKAELRAILEAERLKDLMMHD